MEKQTWKKSILVQKNTSSSNMIRVFIVRTPSILNVDLSWKHQDNYRHSTKGETFFFV